MSEQSKTKKSKCTGRMMAIVWAVILAAIVICSLLLKAPFFWAAVIFIFACIPGFVSAIFNYLKKATEEQENTMKAFYYNWAAYIVLYWIIEAFFVSAYLGSMVWQFVFGGVSLFFTLLGVVTAFLSEKFRVKSLLALDLIAVIAITAYLIYIIQDASLRNVVLVLISSIYGGFITLIGVAWTIKENQRRAEESKRLEVMPFFEMTVLKTDVRGENKFPCLFLQLSEKTGDDIETTSLISLKNIGRGIAHHIRITTTTGYKKDDGYPARNLIFPPNENKNTYVTFSVKKSVEAPGRREDIVVKICFEDMLGNKYMQEAKFIFLYVKETAQIGLFPNIETSSPILLKEK